jgi:hypothetical protein
MAGARGVLSSVRVTPPPSAAGVVQHDHLHLLVEARDADALSRGLRAFEIRSPA